MIDSNMISKTSKPREINSNAPKTTKPQTSKASSTKLTKTPTKESSMKRLELEIVSASHQKAQNSIEKPNFVSANEIQEIFRSNTNPTTTTKSITSFVETEFSDPLKNILSWS